MSYAPPCVSCCRPASTAVLAATAPALSMTCKFEFSRHFKMSLEILWRAVPVRSETSRLKYSQGTCHVTLMVPSIACASFAQSLARVVLTECVQLSLERARERRAINLVGVRQCQVLKVAGGRDLHLVHRDIEIGAKHLVHELVDDKCG